MNEQRIAGVVIGAAAFAALILAAYYYGAGEGRPRPLPAHTWDHSVAFKLRAQQSTRGD